VKRPNEEFKRLAAQVPDLIKLARKTSVAKRNFADRRRELQAQKVRLHRGPANQ
jgi:hypothetical protein